MQDLYDEILNKEVSRALRPPDTFRDSISLAHAALLDALITAAPAKIREAAEAGYSCAVLYEWEHEAMHDGVDVLYLMRGVRRGAFQRPAARRGLPGPILGLLRDALAPFRVIHEWDVAAHTNRLLVRWP